MQNLAHCSTLALVAELVQDRREKVNQEFGTPRRRFETLPTGSGRLRASRPRSQRRTRFRDPIRNSASEIASVGDISTLGLHMLSDREQRQLRKTLTYANGYRTLEMYKEALDELEALNEKQQAQTETHRMYLSIYMQSERWKKALPYANRLAATKATDPGNLVNLAFVTRRANSLEGARIILENAARSFPEEAIIHYNLGCYACCDGELETAKRYLEKAFQLDPSYQKMAKNDEDLDALKDWIQSLNP